MPIIAELYTFISNSLLAGLVIDKVRSCYYEMGKLVLTRKLYSPHFVHHFRFNDLNFVSMQIWYMYLRTDCDIVTRFHRY